ncbi:diacylglycerol/lipid kinase family protein [Rothia nasisuis]|nr:diacylglycerol kinase family protein [Rothia nasisuis]
MDARTTLYSSLAISAALAGAGAVFVVQRGRRARPDLFPAYRPLHRMLEPGDPQQVAVVYNPTKDRAESVIAMITSDLGTANWPKARFYETEADDPGFGMAQRALEEGAQIVLAVGGDGTVRAVASALEGTDVPLGVVPLGTGNLLARNLDMDVSDLHACINMALHGERRAIDMIRMEMQGEQGLDPVNFVVMGGAGFDAQIMTDTKEDLKARIGWLAYVEASTRHMFTRRRSAIITVDEGAPIHRKIRAVLVANTGKIQGGVNLASTAELSDGQLEVIVLTPRNLGSWLRLTAQFIIRPARPRYPVVEHFVGKDVHVRFPGARLPVEVDGDVLGEVTDFYAQVRPGAVLVNVYPEDMQIRSLSDLIDARDDIAQQHRRWWQRLLRL